MLHFVQIPSSSPYDLLVQDECTFISPIIEVKEEIHSDGPDLYPFVGSEFKGHHGPDSIYPSTVSEQMLSCELYII